MRMGRGEGGRTSASSWPLLSAVRSQLIFSIVSTTFFFLPRKLTLLNFIAAGLTWVYRQRRGIASRYPGFISRALNGDRPSSFTSFLSLWKNAPSSQSWAKVLGFYCLFVFLHLKWKFKVRLENDPTHLSVWLAFVCRKAKSFSEELSEKTFLINFPIICPTCAIPNTVQYLPWVQF